ncbi:MAG TPA: hypothetical protein VGJ44_21120 [Kribbellaceae bacterium]
MDGSTVLWIVLAVIAVLVAVALVVMMMRRTSRRLDRDREAANELRQRAAAETPAVEKHEAVAHEVQARARTARAEAEQKLAEAERLEAGAHERSRIAEQSRDDLNERLRRAAALDPDSVDPDTPADRADMATGPRTAARPASEASTADTGWQRNPDTSDTSWRPEPRPPRAEQPSGEREPDPRLADPGWQAGQPPAAGGHARHGSAEAEDDVEQNNPRHAHRHGA